MAIAGGTVCRMHGGSAPQVKEAALQRLMREQIPSINRMIQLRDQTEYPSTAFAASRDILDRTMGKALESVDVTTREVAAKLSDEELAERLAAALAVLKGQ